MVGGHSESSTDELLTGSDAAEHIFKQVVTKKEEGEEITLADLRPLVVFSWLLKPEAVERVDSMSKEIINSGPEGIKATCKASSSKARVVDKKKCVSSLFKKH